VSSDMLSSSLARRLLLTLPSEQLAVFPNNIPNWHALLSTRPHACPSVSNLFTSPACLSVKHGMLHARRDCKGGLQLPVSLLHDLIWLRSASPGAAR
jgi:hypothetical protein